MNVGILGGGKYWVWAVVLLPNSIAKRVLRVIVFSRS